MSANRIEAYLIARPASAGRPPITPETYQVVCEGRGILAEHENLRAMLRILSLFDAEYERGQLPHAPALKIVREGDLLMDGSRAKSIRCPVEPLTQAADRVKNLREAGLPDDFLVPETDDFIRPGGIPDEPR